MSLVAALSSSSPIESGRSSAPTTGLGSPRDLVLVTLMPFTPVVRAGLETLLRQHPRVRLVGRNSLGQQPHLVYYDPATVYQRDLDLLPPRCTKVAVVAALTGPAVRQAREAGADQVVAADLTVEALHRGVNEVAAELSTSGSVRTASGDLTPRERDILTRICWGWSNQEIADDLYLSINSIKTHVRSAYRKLGVTRRSQAVLWGVERGY